MPYSPLSIKSPYTQHYSNIVALLYKKLDIGKLEALFYFLKRTSLKTKTKTKDASIRETNRRNPLYRDRRKSVIRLA